MNPTTNLSLVQRAYQLAAQAHLGQKRRGGADYLDHIDAVMTRAPKDPVDQAVAALHDVLEDRRMTIAQLDRTLSGMTGMLVVDGVITLSRKRSETYERFILRVKNHRSGRWVSVKVADILANLSDSPTPAQIRKYAAALLVLIP